MVLPKNQKNLSNSPKKAKYDATDEEFDEPQDDDQDEDDEDDDDDDDDDEQDEPDERDQAPRKKVNGRPRSASRKQGGSYPVTLVFKKDEDFNEFTAEAADKNLSAAAYALHVVNNRHNTTETSTDLRKTVKFLRNRVARLEGAKEHLQGLYDAERAGRAGGLSGLDADNAPATAKTLKKALDEALAKRDQEARLKQLQELEKDYEKLEKEHEELLTKHEEAVSTTSFPSIVERLAPAAMTIASTRFGPQISGFLGMLSGVAPEPMGLGAGDPADPLVAAVLRARDNISPRQGRDLEQVMDAIGRNPQFVERFAAAVAQFDKVNAQQPPTYTEHSPG